MISKSIGFSDKVGLKVMELVEVFFLSIVTCIAALARMILMTKDFYV